MPGAPPALRASLRERVLELSGREPLPELLDVTLEQVPLPGGPATVARPADWQVLREAEAEAGRVAPLPARGAPSLLAHRPAPPAALADPGAGR